MGFMDISGKRYFDIRELDKVWMPLSAKGLLSLPSDSTKRIDSCTLAAGRAEQAQIEKETIETTQRNDRKLREACNARRKAGGPKFANIQI